MNTEGRIMSRQNLTLTVQQDNTTDGTELADDRRKISMYAERMMHSTCSDRSIY